MDIGTIALAGRAETSQAAAERHDPQLMQTAKDFEAVFVKQMLTHSGLADAFGAEDGVATDTFSSYVLEDIAKTLVENGGFGLAEQFYGALKASEGAPAKGVKL